MDWDFKWDTGNEKNNGDNKIRNTWRGCLSKAHPQCSCIAMVCEWGQDSMQDRTKGAHETLGPCAVVKMSKKSKLNHKSIRNPSLIVQPE